MIYNVMYTDFMECRETREKLGKLGIYTYFPSVARLDGPYDPERHARQGEFMRSEKERLIGIPQEERREIARRRSYLMKTAAGGGR